MILNEIPKLQVEAARDEVTYRLPARPLGFLRLAGLLPLGFSAVWFGFLSKIIVPQFRHLANHPQPFDYFVGAFLLCFIAAGCAPLGMGLGVLFARTRIRWHHGHLSVSERLGPFGWPRRLPRKPIRTFLVAGGPFGSLGLLSVSFANGASRTVTMGYPRPWLDAIAHDLSLRAGLAQATVAPPVEVYQGQAKALAAELAEKPAGSPVVVQRNEASLLLAVPPAGIWKGAGGFLVFGILWCLIIGAVTTAFLVVGPFELKMIPVFALFWLIGLGMLGVAIHMGRCQVNFTAGRSALTVVKSGPFGTRRFEFRRPDIANISAGNSQMEVNHRPVPELQVRLLIGKKIGFLMGRDADELRWIATELRNALGIPATDPAPAPGFAGWPYGRAGSPTPANPLALFIGLVVFTAFAIVVSWRIFPGWFAARQANHSLPAPAATRYPTNAPVSGDPLLVFNAFGPGKTFKPTPVWAAGREAHAEWFVPTRSGNLSEIEVAVTPDDGNPHPGKATLFLTGDKNGFPGRTLESFTVHANQATNLLTLESVKQPALQAGVKYWLAASSPGSWSWHFNNQNIVHNSARQVGKGKWASAGDYCYIGAFSIRVSTNSASAQVAPPAGEDLASTNNH